MIKFPKYQIFYLKDNLELIYNLLFFQFKMDIALAPNPLDQEYLSILKTFMLQIHQRIDQQYDGPNIQTHLLTIIDRASIKIQTQKQTINILEQQLKQNEAAKLNYKEVKGEYAHLQKRLNQKCDQISILRETVKTLYQDNQRISSEKEAMIKEIASLKQNSSNLKKRLKKQEEEIINHKNQLKKLTNITEDKLTQYLKEDEQKQVSIKKLNSELEKQKSQCNKREKSLNTANKKIEQLKTVQQDNEKITKLVQSLKEENHLLLSELQQVKEQHFDDKGKWMKEADSLKHAVDDLREKMEQYKLERREMEARVFTAEEKNAGYQNEIIMRTQKLKQKSKQVKLYSQEINKLSTRVEELSAMSDQILSQNQELNEKCHILEERLEELRSFQSYVTKLKGDINQKKSKELGKLLESLAKLQSHA